MATDLQVEDFDFTGRYYPQILEALVRWLRENVPEVSTENPADLAIQLLRAFALTGHLNNVLIDLLAHEALFPTAQLRDTVVAHLKLIGYKVDGDIPARTCLVFQLTKSFNAAQIIAQDNSVITTRRTSTAVPIPFEVDDVVQVDRTDRLSGVYQWDTSGSLFGDFTVESYTDASVFSAFPQPPEAGDALYIGHNTAMSNKLKVGGILVPSSDITVVWEVYKEDVQDAAPDTVTILGSQLRFIVDGLLGTTASRAGLEVTVELNSSGAKEVGIVEHDGSNNYVDVSLLGQTSVSTTPADYTVGSNWYELPGLDDETVDTGGLTLEQDGDIAWTLPKTSALDWNKTIINNLEAFWIRLRCIEVGGSPIAPVLDTLEWDDGQLFVESPATQGITRTQPNVGLSNGEAGQTFVLGNTNVIDGTVDVSVDAVAWTAVDNFLNSNSIDTHYAVDIDSEGVATVTFGDGTNGSIPNAGTTISAVYRTDAHDDGNVGSGTIIRPQGGLAFVRRIFNPSASRGWQARRGSTDQDLELLKLEGPADLRTLGRAVSPDDAEYLAVAFKASDGTSPVARAKAVEGGFGEKTITVFVVGPDGGAVPTSYRLELEEYFNGNDDTGVSGIMVANQRAFVRDAELIPFDISLDLVTGKRAIVESSIRALINPLSVDDDGITYSWEFGEDVQEGQLFAAIFSCGGDAGRVVINTFVVSSPPFVGGVYSIPDNSLPTIGTLSVTGGE